MRRSLVGILILSVVAALAAVASGCEVSDPFAPKQRTQIESYLSKQALDYRLVGDSVYVHVAGNNLPEQEQVAIAKDDGVVFNFEAYTFTSSPASLPYYTNKAWLAERLGTTIDTSYWDFEPMSVRLGTGAILKGVEDALIDCSRGDSVVVFLTSSNAYGDRAMGVVPANTAVMMVLNVLEVEK